RSTAPAARWRALCLFFAGRCRRRGTVGRGDERHAAASPEAPLALPWVWRVRPHPPLAEAAGRPGPVPVVDAPVPLPRLRPPLVEVARAAVSGRGCGWNRPVSKKDRLPPGRGTCRAAGGRRFPLRHP